MSSTGSRGVFIFPRNKKFRERYDEIFRKKTAEMFSDTNDPQESGYHSDNQKVENPKKPSDSNETW